MNHASRSPADEGPVVGVSAAAPRPGSRQQRKRLATREAILDAAERLVEGAGADALTLPAVSEEADVSVQTIYNRVGGRDAVLLAVAERALAANRVYMDEAYATPGSPVERIRAAAAAYAMFAVERPHQFRLLVAPPDVAPTLPSIAAIIEEQNGKLAQVIRDGQADGSMRADLDADRTATLLWATINGVLGLTWNAALHDVDLASLLADYGDLLGRAILVV